MIFANLPAVKTAVILAGMMSCAPQAPANVDTHYARKDPVTTNNLSTAQLGQFSVDTKVSHSPKEVFTTGGITEGKIGANFKVEYKTLTNENSACIWMNKITVNITYDPIIHIASEYAPGTCRYKETLQHEARHVNTDLITLNDYLPKIDAAIKQAAAQNGVVGPLPTSQTENASKALSSKIEAALTAAINDMDRTRLQRQQLIDTRQEYLRLSKLCPQGH